MRPLQPLNKKERGQTNSDARNTNLKKEEEKSVPDI